MTRGNRGNQNLVNVFQFKDSGVLMHRLHEFLNKKLPMCMKIVANE